MSYIISNFPSIILFFYIIDWVIDFREGEGKKEGEREGKGEGGGRRTRKGRGRGRGRKKHQYENYIDWLPPAGDQKTSYVP